MSPTEPTYPYELNIAERDAISSIREHVPAQWSDKAEEYIASLMRLAYHAGSIEAYNNVKASPWKA